MHLSDFVTSCTCPLHFSAIKYYIYFIMNQKARRENRELKWQLQPIIDPLLPSPGYKGNFIFILKSL